MRYSPPEQANDCGYVTGECGTQLCRSIDVKLLPDRLEIGQQGNQFTSHLPELSSCSGLGRSWGLIDDNNPRNTVTVRLNISQFDVLNVPFNENASSAISIRSDSNKFHVL